VLSTAAELLLGALAGALAQVFTIPVSVIATRQQVSKSSKNKRRDNSFSGVARDIIREEGVTGLWLGMGASLVLTVNPAITYGVFERIKSLLILARTKVGTNPMSDKLSPGHSFAVGALSKTLATVVSENPPT
jgi:solute carrier family 25 (peroxisomal adenine nucleotide transporter), member 17